MPSSRPVKPNRKIMGPGSTVELDPNITTSYSSFMEYVFKGMAATLFALGGWIGVTMKSDIRETKRLAQQAKDEAGNSGKELLEYKLHVAQSYVPVSTIERFHNRLDTIEGDIKELLSRK